MNAHQCLFSATPALPAAGQLRVLLATLGLCVACALPAAAWADDRADHDAARDALVRGQVMPLKNVLEHLARQRPGGHILEVELENKRGRWVYDIKQLEAGGQLVKLKLDAQTGELLSDRSKHQPLPRPNAPSVPAPAPAPAPSAQSTP